MPSRSSARNKDRSNIGIEQQGRQSCADRMAADQARFCSLRPISGRSRCDRAPKRRRTAPRWSEGYVIGNRRSQDACVLINVPRFDNVHSHVRRKESRFVPKMPRLIGHAPRVSRLVNQAVFGVQVRLAFRRAFASRTAAQDRGQGDFCGFSGFDEVCVFRLHVWIGALSGDDNWPCRAAWQDVGTIAANQ